MNDWFYWLIKFCYVIGRLFSEMFLKYDSEIIWDNKKMESIFFEFGKLNLGY